MSGGAVEPIAEPGDVRAITDGRRARRREVLRNKVYDAAIELFTKQGYDTTTIDAIAERADVARNTVFNHFPQKMASCRVGVTASSHHGGRAGAGRRARRPRRAGRKSLRRCMAELAALSTADRRQTVMVMDASARHSDILSRQPLAAVFTPIVAAGQDRGEFSTTPQPDLVGAVLAGIYCTTLLRWIAEEPAPFHLATQLDAMLDIVFTGL